MTSVIFAPQAHRDIEAIGDWIARENPRRAATFVLELYDACEDLTLFPDSYPQVLGRPTLRRKIYGRYLIFFRPDDPPQVLRVLHSARDWPEIIDRLA